MRRWIKEYKCAIIILFYWLVLFGGQVFLYHYIDMINKGV